MASGQAKATATPVVDDTVVREAIIAAFRAGFEAGYWSTGEGDNGEYGDLVYTPGATPDPYGDRAERYERALAAFWKQAQDEAAAYLAGLGKS